MNIFNIFKRKKADELQPLKVKKVSLSQRIANTGKKQYTAKVAITYEGKPMRQFETTVSAHSRANAAYKVENGLGVKLISVVQKKKQ